jgi:cullin-associated NEDD8-dissociated protein 1
MQSSDKDYRFMATNDLMIELQKETIKLDEESEKKIVKMLLRLLEDKNGEVQNLAVKCLGPLVGKVKDVQVETVVETLCTNMTSENEQLRDISSIGLKTVIAELPQTSSGGLISIISKKITGRLSDSVAQRADVTVQLESLDILTDLLNRFGPVLTQYHEKIQEALLPQLRSPRLAVRKRSITAISYLLVCCNQHILTKTVTFLLEELSAKSNSTSEAQDIRTYIQCVAAVSRQAGHRFGHHLAKLNQLVVRFVRCDDDELREYCIQAMESFVRKCPKEVTEFLPQIISISLEYLCHDPNYNYDDAEEDEMEMDNEDDADSNEEYSDDDDMSWKVRRASAKCLEAVISTRHEMIIELYHKVSPALISRFKEREENVKVDVFSAYVALLKQTRAPADTLSLDSGMDQDESAVTILQSHVKDIIKSLHRQLREKSIKTRQGAFHLLTELLHVLPHSLHDDAATLIPGILYSLSDKNSSSNIKIDALCFLNTFLKSNPPQVFQPHTQTLLPAVLSAVTDSFYKISSEALLVLVQMIRVIRPTPGSDSFPFQSYIRPIYETNFAKLKAADIDQEVKERAITCVGQLISTFGDHMTEELRVCLPLLVDRLRNEITRLTCVKALTVIASSPFRIDFSPLLPEAFPILASFLRKNQRALKLATLTLLDTICRHYTSYLNRDSICIILNDVPPLINENDLHVSQLTLTLLTSLTRMHSDVQDMAIIPQKILPETLLLVRSPLLQGAALNSVLEFFQSLVRSSFPGLDYQALVRQLTLPIYQAAPNPMPLHKHAYHSIAKCVAAMTTVDQEHSLAAIRFYLNNLKSGSVTDTVVAFIFLVIGEIGKTVDTSTIPELKEKIIESFSSHSEEVKSAASFALGSVSSANLSYYLPFVLQQIESRNRKQYLLLHSLKEIINCESSGGDVSLLQPHLEAIWALLLRHCECPEEGTRNVVAECLGKLTLMNPPVLLPSLKGYLQHESPLARATVVTAMKFTISDQPQAIDAQLKNCIGDFFRSLEDPDINVRRVALVAFNSAAHNKPSLIRDLLHSILPQLYNETQVRKELIREVEMGPFKHTVDDGLDVRKAAFECMYTLLDSCLDRIDIFDFLSHVENGLKDHYDIKMLTHLMLVRLSTLCPSAVLNRKSHVYSDFCPITYAFVWNVFYF